MSNELIFNAGDTGFDSLKIKYNDYMRSLLTVAEGEGMVNQAEIAFVQARLMKSLGDLINPANRVINLMERYNRGEKI